MSQFLSCYIHMSALNVKGEQIFMIFFIVDSSSILFNFKQNNLVKLLNTVTGARIKVKIKRIRRFENYLIGLQTQVSIQ